MAVSMLIVAKPHCCCSVQGMSNEDLKGLQTLVEVQTQENLGMSMIYTIVTAAQEWLQDKVNDGTSHCKLTV